MRILVACEESQEVCKAFRELGHDAFSCDIEKCSGGHPEWHIEGDVLPLLNGNCKFETADGLTYYQAGRWDMILAFPPCTHLSSSGQHWFARGLKDPQLREDGVNFFMRFVNADCDRIAIENPVGIMSTRYRKPDQIIQPWMFGHGETKQTCLWLKGLPKLEPTNIVEGREHRILAMGPSENRRKMRSKTYHGVALAMAEQWGKELDDDVR